MTTTDGIGATPPTETAIPKRIRFWRSAPVLVVIGVLMVGLAYGWMGLVGGLAGPHAKEPAVITIMCLGAATIGLVLYCTFTRVVERRRERDELVWSRAPTMLPLGIAIGATFMCAVVGTIATMGGYRIEGLHAIGALWIPLAFSLSSGVVEELMFRGVVFRVIERRRGSWFALVFSAALFGFVHLANPNADLLSASAIALEAGLMLGACYMAFRTLWVSIGIHLAWNFVQGGVFGIAVSGYAIEGLFKSRMDGPSWLTGGAFGAEASLSALVLGLLLFLALLARANRLGRVVRHADARAATAREYREASAPDATL